MVEPMKAYKIVSRAVDGRYFSYSAAAHYDEVTGIEYKPGEHVYAPPELYKLGYGLCVFENLYHVKLFVLQNCSYSHNLKAVFECECGPRVWAPRVPLLHSCMSVSCFKDMLYRELESMTANEVHKPVTFPYGTLMTDSVRLTRPLYIAMEINQLVMAPDDLLQGG